MKKYLLIMAAFAAALTVSAISSAGAAGASTGTGAQLCAGQSWHMGAEQYRQLRARTRHHPLSASA